MTDIEAELAAEETRPATKGRLKAVLMLIVPLAMVAAGLFFWLTGGKTVSTDNAYVKQDIVSVSAQVAGPVVEVFVTEGQHVEAGEPLFRIDPEPARIALMQAEAQLAAAQLQTRQLGVVAAGTGADIEGAKATLAVRRSAFDRQAALLERGFTTKAAYEEAANAVAVAENALADARARAANASAALAPGEQPQVAAAKAAIEQARLNLRYGMVRAPISGVVTKSQKVLPGQSVIPGVGLMSIVRDDTAWVEANFKEGDLSRMTTGLPATVRFDAYPGLVVKGHVETIGAGTGSEFSVLPAQNANGNWVKTTQRVPVRIAFDEAPARDMIAGLSVEVEVELAE
ncbi:HlyD family secretion protein [Sphingomicrobium aestuariivivum]|uniref:HlyD family secretion protein n=1 Tax=Sphingomicrobium aestuariivivum TaxID=1582356 RepID=UPI001FD64B9C|nr:HlyD family secretion protein [Sphingomicrobium aestuariivivum]MCJ8191930.1 HlyD family secretion protein [Sphingomicrobium aestuariivivum]